MGIVLHGVAAGKGIAIGRAHLVVRGHEEVPQYDLAENGIAASKPRLKPPAANWNKSAARYPKTPPPNWARSSPCT